MAFSMFSSQAPPITIDFGSSSVKLLQVSPGDHPRILAAAEVHIPDPVRADTDKLHAFYATALPPILAKGGFKSRRAVMAIPAIRTFIQHMQIAEVTGTSQDDLIKSQLYSQLGCTPSSVVVRSLKVADVHRGGQMRSEIICFAIARDTVMRYVELIKKCKLNVVGVQTEAVATVRAFDHLNRRADDVNVTTLYVDIGSGGTHVSIGHGREIVFARHIQIGGSHFDQLIAAALNCDIADARAHRMALQKDTFQTPRNKAPEHGGTALLEAAAAAHGESSRKRKRAAASTEEADRRSSLTPSATCLEVPGGEPSSWAGKVDFSELLDTITDELSMCLRYHQGLFPERAIDRSIFIGGEARQVWLCQHVVRALRLPAQLGDPLSRLDHDGATLSDGLSLDEPQPGWTVAYGMCNAPTDL